MNQRPIGCHTSTPEDGTYLCPNDLLLGRASSHAPQGPFQERSSNKYRFDYIQAIVKAFWKKWSRDVFPALVIRPKWHVEQRNLEKGDIVLIQDSNAIRGEWKLGKVTDVFPGDDGKVRRVMVAYKNLRPDDHPTVYRGIKYTTVERPVQRLILLVAVDEQIKMWGGVFRTNVVLERTGFRQFCYTYIKEDRLFRKRWLAKTLRTLKLGRLERCKVKDIFAEI